MNYTQFPIESGIPIPTGHGATRPFRYPWMEMEVGQSFFIPVAVPGERTTRANSLNGSRSHQEKKTGRSFLVRTVEGGVRVWRTA